MLLLCAITTNSEAHKWVVISPRKLVQPLLNNRLYSEPSFGSIKHPRPHMTRTQNNSLLQIKMWCHLSSERLVINFISATPPPPPCSGGLSVSNRRKRAWQSRPAPISTHTGCHGIIMTSYRKSMIPLFFPVCSPQQLSVYQNVQYGLSLATKNGLLMHAVQNVSPLLILLWEIYGHTGKPSLQSTQTTFLNKLPHLLIIICNQIPAVFRLLCVSTNFKGTQF